MSVRPHSGWRKRMFKALVKRDGERCAQCGTEGRTIWRQMGVWGSYAAEGVYSKVNPSSNLEIDHRRPLHMGGDNDLGNLWLLCRACHKAKSAKERSRSARHLTGKALA